jgi:hypothetical protein
MNAPVVLPTISRLGSPVLRAFELNPFRALRLRVDATTSLAASQAESALTLVRVGMRVDDPDLLPWLVQPDPYELQQAAQAIEEPLVRLKHQMMWFDQVRDPQAAALEAALRDPPGEALQRYLDLEVALPQIPAEGELPPADHGAVAHAINQANIRLLAVAATLSGLQSGRADRVVVGRPITRNEWKELGGFQSLAQAHTVLLAEQVAMVARFDTRRCWEEALKRWMNTLGHPWLVSYLDMCIAALGDDFVTADDIEAVQDSIRMQLADLSMRETRHLLLEGRFDPASALIAAVAEARIEARVLMPAMQPLRQVFRAELTELEPLLEQPLDQGLEQIGRYLSRLEVIRTRWLALDGQNVIGLADVLDEAAEKAYLHLRQVAKPSEKADALLQRVGAIGAAQSLRERVATCRKEMSEARERICEFCKIEDPDYEKSVVLKGKKETGREHHFNSTTIYYTVRHAIMLRCARCAQLHDFVRRAGTVVGFASAAGFGMFAWEYMAPISAAIISVAPQAGLVIFAAAVFAFGAAVFLVPLLGLPFGLGALTTSLLSKYVTPAGHRRCGDYDDSKSAVELRRDGYGIEVDWSSNALARVPKK